MTIQHQHMLANNKSKKAFTVIEAMVIAFILAVSSAGILTLIVESLRMNAIAKENLLVRHTIDTKVEEIRNAGWDFLMGYNNQQINIEDLSNQRAEDHPNDPDFHGFFPLSGNLDLDTTETIALNNMRVRVEADLLQITETATVMNVTLDIWWNGVAGNQHKVELVTFVNEGN